MIHSEDKFGYRIDTPLGPVITDFNGMSISYLGKPLVSELIFFGTSPTYTKQIEHLEPADTIALPDDDHNRAFEGSLYVLDKQMIRLGEGVEAIC